VPGRTRCNVCRKKANDVKYGGARGAWLWYTYKITEEEYDVMYEAQEGMCAICRAALDQLFVDHDHETEEVRGLLCRSCNLGIGFLQDDAGLVASALDYLTEPIRTRFHR